MKYILAFALYLSVFQVQAQSQDTLVSINFFGTHHAVQNREALSMSELKQLTKQYPEARKAFVKTRNIRHMQVALQIISVFPFVYALSSTDENALLLGISASALITVLEVTLLQDRFNSRLDKTVELYNRKE